MSPVEQTRCEQKIASNTLERQKLHELTTLVAEIKRLLVRHDTPLQDADVSREMQSLEEWLEQERKGPAPAGSISLGALAWLESLRNRVKMAAEEAQRFESEGGTIPTGEQAQRIENLVKTMQRIDVIIGDAMCTPSNRAA